MLAIRVSVSTLEVAAKISSTVTDTLTNNSQYFAAKFSGNWSEGCSYKDDRGRQICFIERDGEAFEYILSYLRTPVRLPAKLPAFHDNPTLWRALRVEADYYGLTNLSDLLRVTYSYSPVSHGDRGVLYWLGTNKGQEQEYRNPFKSGVVHVGGWVDMTKQELEAIGDYDSDIDCAATLDSRAILVQYRPEVYGGDSVLGLELTTESNYCHILFCEHSGMRKPVVVDFKFVLLKPTHFSIRHHLICGGGMSAADWDFEGSVDGLTWDTLFMYREDDNESRGEYFSHQLVNKFVSENAGEENKDIVTSWVERNHRETWSLNPLPTVYYRYFRIIGAGAIEEDCRCMHGLGLELYGDVHEP